MGLFGSYVYRPKDKERKNEKWWLHVKEIRKTKFYYFSKNPEGALPGLPAGYEVVENSRSRLPMLKKKAGKRKKEAKKK
jgi:hypothetical protein